MPLRFRPSREARPFDDDQSAPVHGLPTANSRCGDGRLPPCPAVRIRECHMDHAGNLAVATCLAVEIRLGPRLRTVHELVGYEQGAGSEFRSEAADRAGAEDLARAHTGERPQVGTIVDLVWWQVMIATVAGKEGHSAPGHLAEKERVARWAVGRFDSDFSHII